MKVKNIQFVKSKLIPLLVAGTISVSVMGCNGNVDMSEVSFNHLMSISDVKDNTIIDELIEEGQLRYDDEMSYVDACDRLTRYMDISDSLKDINFDEYDRLNPLSDEEYLSTLYLTDDEISSLKDIVNGKTKTLVEQEKRLTAYKKLGYLNNYCTDYICNNGKDICETMMFASIKGAVADELGLDSFKSITIPKYFNAGDGPSSYSIQVGNDTYTIPVGSGEIWNTVNYLYSLQSYKFSNDLDVKEFENVKATCRKAINYAMTTTAAGVNIKGNKITCDNNASNISRNYLK